MAVNRNQVSQPQFKSGFVAVVGKPNVGKSCIVNYLVNKKVAIVSDKPETTRDTIHGILTVSGAQVIFVDTPGIHKPHLLLGKEMVRKAQSSLFEADLLLFTIEVTTGIRDEDSKIIEMIRQSRKPAIALINKIDSTSKGRILPLIEQLSHAYGFLDIIPISALTGDNMELLREKVISYLPLGEQYYPKQQFSDKDDRFQIAEIIREQVLLLTREEVPHSIAVLIEGFTRSDGILDINAIIYVERDSQKGIIIGQQGEMIKKISTRSRRALGEVFEGKISLRLWVKVLRNWRKDPQSLRLLKLC